jgi:RNA polymerase subunit RPABC4/transcription elongation factor Spt4
MDTKRCANCHKLSRADAVTCRSCGQSFSENATRIPTSTRGFATTAGSKGSAIAEKATIRTRRRTIPPASPHRAGHHSGLHPEDQPYQSAMIAVQRPPERHADTGEQKEPEIEYLPTSPQPVKDDDPTFAWSKAPTEIETIAFGRSALDRYLPFYAERKKPLPGYPFWQGRYVPAVLIIACLLFLVASSLLAYAFINKKPDINTQVLSAIPNQLRVNDTFTLAGKGFGTNDLITFTHDQDNKPILDGSGKPLQAHADDTGAFSVQILIPTSWDVGQHIVHAIDIGKDQTLSVSAIIRVEKSSLAPPLLQLTSSIMDFGVSNPGDVSKKAFILVNAGGRQVAWQASSDQPWLSISPNSGTFSGSAITQVTANSGALSPQSYTGHITFIQQGKQLLTLTVDMIVKAAPSASLAIAPVSLAYSGTAQQNPGDQVITLQNTTSQALDWSASVVTGDGASWLSINSRGNRLAAHSSETVTVSVQSQSLAVGSYQGTINFKGGTNPAVTVALNVTAAGNIIASPLSLSFASIGQNPVAQSVKLQNTGGGPLDWWVTTFTVDGANWLNATPASGHLEMNQAANVAVSINVAALKPKSYQGTLTITYGVGGQTVQVPVSLSVSIPPTPSIGVSQSALNFSSLLGANPSPQSFSISNTGKGTLNWTIIEDQNGATFAPVSPSSGSLAPGKSTAITVNPSVARASVGTLTTNITVADSDSGSSVPKQRITVSIVMKGQPRVALSLNAMTFNHDSIINSSSQLLDISNSGTDTLNWTAQSSAPWLTGFTPSGSLSTGNDALIEVNCISSTMSPGTYTATLTISDSDAGTTVVSQSVTVTLVVT